MLAEIAIVASILCFSYKKSSKIRKTTEMKRNKESYIYLFCLEDYYFLDNSHLIHDQCCFDASMVAR